jgi:tryptophan 2-monooxygenase
MQAAIRDRDVKTIKVIWEELVEQLDDTTFYGFLASLAGVPLLPAPRGLRPGRLRHRRLGHRLPELDAGDPAGGLHRRRRRPPVHRRSGSQQIPVGLWRRGSRRRCTGRPAPAWRRCTRAAAAARGDPAAPHRRPTAWTVTDEAGGIRTYEAAVFTAQSWNLLSRIVCDEELFPIDHWTAIERTHYMGSTKLFCLVDRPFWKDVDPQTGRHRMSMTLSDRMTRGHVPARPGRGQARADLPELHLGGRLVEVAAAVGDRAHGGHAGLAAEIYPDVDLRRHVIARR